MAFETPVRPVFGPQSVSYTHLDVYKRQGLANTLFFCGMAPALVNDLSRVLPDATCLERLDAINHDHPLLENSKSDRELFASIQEAMRDWVQQDRRDRPALVIHAVSAWLAERTTEEMCIRDRSLYVSVVAIRIVAIASRFCV